MPARAAELAFLPAALEVERTPPLPAARILLWTMLGCVLVAVAWACLGEVDVVAVAPGRVVPAGRVKPVQAAVTGSVRTIAVAEGDAVRAGQLLVALDDTAARADLERLQAERHFVADEHRRLTALLERVTGAARATELRPALALRVAREFASFDAERRALAAARDEAAAERAALAAGIARIDAVLPLVEERAAAYATLAARAQAARVQWLEIEQSRLTHVHERAGLAARHAAAGAAEARAVRRLAAHVSGAEARWRAERAAAGQRLDTLASDIDKAQRRGRELRLLAPVDGSVQQLAVFSADAVVTAGQVLMRVVPAAPGLEVEARVLNKDSGFVRAGQAAVIKVETYPFTRHGTLAGTIAGISRDAINDEQAGPVYLARVVPTARTLAGGEPLAAGMAVSVEVDLGRRRLIEFLLGPLLRYRDEGFTER